MLPKQIEYKVGMYMRLSKDDERSGESLSIENQRKVLTSYIGEQGWTLYDEYVDDGISGTTFDRPGVQRLLDDAKAGRINLILCKDLSRFGRNYIQVGQYTDYIFPMYNIRFIALTDNVDTANSDSASMDMMPIMNIFNEWHAANTSKKVKAVIESGAKSGKYRTTFSSFGYVKGDDEKRTPVIEPYAANIVHRIFEMRAAGYNVKKIATILNDEHVPSPGDYRYMLAHKDNPTYTNHLWGVVAIKRILRNPIYIGNLAQLRTTTVSYKNHKVIRKDESDWIVVENNHEPIISKELWDKAHEVDASVSTGKMTKEGVTMPLSGLCYCADCGSKMKQQSSSGGYTNAGYACGRYAYYGKKYCTSHFITIKTLNKIVLADIQRQIDFVMNDDKAREKYLAKKRGLYAEKHGTDRKRLHDMSKRMAELDRLIASVYEDKVTGKMPEDIAFTLLDKYQGEKKSMEAEYDELQKCTDMAKQDEADVDEYIRRLKSYAGAEELTRQMALDLIEYITLDKNPRKKAITRDIHIYYKLIDRPLNDKRNALA